MGGTNLLEETVAAMPGPALWVGSGDGKYAMSWEEFAEIARRTNYDNGSGSQEVADDLVVVGDGWWMERAEYIGVAEWSVKAAPVRGVSLPFKTVLGGMWSSLEEQQEMEVEHG